MINLGLAFQWNTRVGFSFLICNNGIVYAVSVHYTEILFHHRVDHPTNPAGRVRANLVLILMEMYNCENGNVFTHSAVIEFVICLLTNFRK